jgi:hypothetical protein
MGKLKTAILRAQETADTIKIQVNRPVGYRIASIGPGGVEYNVKTDKAWDDDLLWQARDALSDAINNPEPDEGLTSAEKALHLINTYLLESELCKR